MAGRLEERGKNKWRLTVSGGTNEQGKRIRHTKTITANSRREAEKQLAKFVTEMEANPVKCDKLTLEKFAAKWMEQYAEGNLSPNTVRRYKDILDRHIIPALGHKKIDQIKPTHLLQFYTLLQEDGVRSDDKPGGLSAKTITQYHRLLSSILQAAVQWQYIVSNPVSRVKPPKAEKKITQCLDPKQVEDVLKCLCAENIKYQAIINLALATGLRRGELMGLNWADIDWEEALIDVNKAAYYIKGKGCITSQPKSETSKRKVSVPQSVLAILKEYKKQKSIDKLALGEEWTNSPRVFTNDFGSPMFPEHISHWWRKFLKKHDLPHIRFHGLRHTSATLLILQGVHAKTISSRLGHSNISITMDIYGHTLQSADQEAAKKLEKIFHKTV